MGSRISLESDEERYDGMLEIADRGLGSFRVVSIRDIFKKPLLTSSESSSTTTEDPIESCPFKFHEEEQDDLQNGVENCCRCHRPKVTEPADGCPCQCHITVQKPNSSDDNRSDRAPSEQPVGSLSCDNEPELHTNEPELHTNEPEESPSVSNANQWGFTSWFFRTPSKESPSNPSAGNLPMEPIAEETSICSSFHDLSDAFEKASEESPRSPPTTSWWDFHMISNWMHQAESINTQSSSDENPLQPAPHA